MPRPSKGPRLYWHAKRQRWIIRDGTTFVSTGCGAGDVGRAETALASYIGRKWRPPIESASVADILTAYMKDKGGYGRRAENIRHCVGNLLRWFGQARISDITSGLCRGYVAERPRSAARRDLQTLRAAVNHWHKEYGPLATVPAVWLPPKEEARERWLTRSEAARLLRAARRTPHLARFVLLGLYTGSRSGVLFAVKWEWISLEAGVMARRAAGEADSATKRRPPVRLGRRILAHLRRWRRIDERVIANRGNRDRGSDGHSLLDGGLYRCDFPPMIHYDVIVPVRDAEREVAVGAPERLKGNHGSRTGGATPPTGATTHVIHFNVFPALKDGDFPSGSQTFLADT